MDAASAFQKLKTLKTKCSELASLAIAKVHNPLESSRVITQHNQNVEEVKSAIDSTIDTITSRWTSISGAGSNNYVAKRDARDSIREASASLVSPAPVPSVRRKATDLGRC